MMFVDTQVGALRSERNHAPGGWPDAMVAIGEARGFRRGDVIMNEREHEPCVHLILFGKVVRQRRMAHGEVTLFDLHSRGELLGVASVLDGGKQLDTVVALTRVSTIAIEQDTFSDLLHRDPLARLRFDEQVARWVRHDSTRAASIATERVDVRLRRLLRDLARRFGVRGDSRGLMVDLSLTRGQIAGLLGTANETAIRQINRLRDANLVVTEGRTFFIPDVEALGP